MTIPVSDKSTRKRSTADRRILINAATLIALGLSVLILDSWPNLFVRVFVGLFWGSFFLILNGPGLVQTFRHLSRANAEQRAVNEPSAAYRQRISSY